MRVAIDAIPLVENKTGVGHYTDALSDWLARTHSDHQYELISPFNFDFGPRSEKPENLAKFFTPVRSKFRKWWLIGLPSLLFISPFDVFHGTNYCIPVFSPCPTVVTIHDMSLWTQASTHDDENVRRGKRRIPIMARKASMIIAPSEATRREIIEILRINPDRIRVISEAARTNMQPQTAETIAAVKAKYGILGDYVLYTGTIEPRKNLLRLIRAYEEVLKGAESKPQLVVCGGRGWKDQEVFELIGELKLQQQVKFTGYVPDCDLPALYSGAMVFAYPSLYEGFGLPPLEAMACGAPVLTSATSSLPEVVGEAGIKVDPTDVHAIARELGRMIADQSLRLQLGQKGLERSRLFSWERAANETQSVYDHVFEEHRRRQRI